MSKPNAPQYSRATLTRKVKCNSLQAQRVMRRSFEVLKRSLFALSVIMRISYDELKVEQIEKFIADEFLAVETEIQKAKSQMLKILEDHGVEERVDYTLPEEFVMTVDTPFAMSFLRLVGDLDELIILIETVWLSGNFDNRQRKNATYQWQQRLIKLAGRVIGIERKARQEAERNGKADEINAVVPYVQQEEHDAELEEASTEAENEMVPLLKVG